MNGEPDGQDRSNLGAGPLRRVQQALVVMGTRRTRRASATPCDLRRHCREGLTARKRKYRAVTIIGRLAPSGQRPKVVEKRTSGLSALPRGEVGQTLYLEARE